MLIEPQCCWSVSVMVRQSTDLLSYWLLLLIASVYIIQTEAQYIGIYPWGSHVSAEDRMQEIVSLVILI